MQDYLCFVIYGACFTLIAEFGFLNSMLKYFQTHVQQKQ